jgi:putative membrane-bound dehydrogenase-like protein
MLHVVVVVILAIGAITGPAKTPDGPPYAPADALETFEVADGFQIEVFASEPLITDPVDMEVDEYGRIYVVEMPGYPLDTGGSGRVKLLSDTDADGYPDTSTIFAEGLTLPTGVMRWKNGIIVTDAPHVYYLEDTDGDGRADTKEVVLTGFALSNPQHNFNNPLYGLDNGIFLANNGPIHTEAFAETFGDRGSEVRFADSFASGQSGDRTGFANGNVRLDVNASNRNVRFRPDTGELESLSSWSQWGHTFDIWGRHFLVGNANHQFHEVVAARYLERNLALPVRDVLEFTPDHGDAADVFPITLAPDHQLLTDRGVFTSASGITWYSGGVFSEPYDRVAFVAEPVHNLVHADLVEQNGATFVARRVFEVREFLASTDSWFRPVNFYVGPDGALYVIDYYREIVEHPEWMDDEAAKNRDLTRGTDRGRIYRISTEAADRPNWLDALSLGDASTADMIATLEHPNAWWRLHAQRLLVDQSADSGIQALRTVLRSGATPSGRLHAMWTLEGLGILSEDDIQHALRDSTAGVRENGIRLAERHGAAAFEEVLSEMSSDPDPRVRFQLLLTLGNIETSLAEDARNRLLMRDLDDGWMQIAALTAGTQPTIRQLTETVDRLEADRRPGADAYVRRIAMLVAASGTDAAIGRGIALVIENPRRYSAGAVLQGLAEGIRQRSGQHLLTAEHTGALFELFFEAPEDDALRAAILAIFRAARNDHIDADMLARAIDIAADSTMRPSLRADALMLIEIEDPESFTSELMELAHDRTDANVEAAAIRALGRTTSSEVAGFLLSQWSRLSGAGREATLDILIRSEASVRLLLDAVESDLITPSAIGWHRRVGLMRDWDGPVKERARRLLRASDAGRVDVLQRYQEALDIVGNAANGRTVYEAACASCHAVRDGSVVFGPDLGTVSHWSPRALLDAVLAPSRSIADGYEQWRIVRRGGDVAAGILRTETAAAVTLAMPGGLEVTIPRQDVQAMQLLEGSAMPDGLERQISTQEMADLFAFLMNPQ